MCNVQKGEILIDVNQELNVEGEQKDEKIIMPLLHSVSVVLVRFNYRQLEGL
jgi:hypothetical protein